MLAGSFEHFVEFDELKFVQLVPLLLQISLLVFELLALKTQLNVILLELLGFEVINFAYLS